MYFVECGVVGVVVCVLEYVGGWWIYWCVMVLFGGNCCWFLVVRCGFFGGEVCMFWGVVKWVGVVYLKIFGECFWCYECMGIDCRGWGVFGGFVRLCEGCCLVKCGSERMWYGGKVGVVVYVVYVVVRVVYDVFGRWRFVLWNVDSGDCCGCERVVW